MRRDPQRRQPLQSRLDPLNDLSLSSLRMCSRGGAVSPTQAAQDMRAAVTLRGRAAGAHLHLIPCLEAADILVQACAAQKKRHSDSCISAADGLGGRQSGPRAHNPLGHTQHSSRALRTPGLTNMLRRWERACRNSYRMVAISETISRMAPSSSPPILSLSERAPCRAPGFAPPIHPPNLTHERARFRRASEGRWSRRLGECLYRPCGARTLGNGGRLGLEMAGFGEQCWEFLVGDDVNGAKHEGFEGPVPPLSVVLQAPHASRSL